MLTVSTSSRRRLERTFKALRCVAIDLSELAVNDEVAVSSLAAAAPVAPKPKAPAAKPSREKKAAEQYIPVGLARLAPAPSIYPLASRDWLPLLVYTRWPHATGSCS
eukprot:1195864-Prorocentrum_minimum.AAC.2